MYIGEADKDNAKKARECQNVVCRNALRYKLKQLTWEVLYCRAWDVTHLTVGYPTKFENDRPDI